jgi:predicted RNA binding protein YcfA (HicA-like mRNA interferase family)
MPKLPSVSGQEIIRALERLGFVVVSQKGSHVKMRRDGKICVVPTHKEVKKGTLAGILRQADLAVGDFVKALSQ